MADSPFPDIALQIFLQLLDLAPSDFQANSLPQNATLRVERIQGYREHRQLSPQTASLTNSLLTGLRFAGENRENVPSYKITSPGLSSCKGWPGGRELINERQRKWLGLPRKLTKYSQLDLHPVQQRLSIVFFGGLLFHWHCDFEIHPCSSNCYDSFLVTADQYSILRINHNLFCHSISVDV